jgi:o-succinylbenzoate---CoA ligase
MAKRICPLSANEKKFLAIAPHWTYAQLDCLTKRAVRQLQSLGLKRGDCIALIAHPNESMIALLFASWRLSLIVTLISPRLPHFTVQKYLAAIPTRLLIDDPTPFFAESADESCELDMDRIALLLLTSGSSGSPKWAAFSLCQLFDSAQTVVQALDAQPQDRWLLSLPLYHVGGLGVLLRAVCSKGTIVLENKELPYPTRIHSANARFASLIPTQLYRLVHSDDQPLTTALLIGGAPLSQNLYERAIERNYRLFLTYGLTEMGSSIFLTSQPVWKNRIPHLGHPLPGRQVKIFQNELLVRGSCLFAGYGHPPHRPFAEWFATGDCARFIDDGGFAIVGRKDFQFISGGENIQPEEIEIALLSHPLVEQALVVPLLDEEFGALPMAFVKTSSPHHHLIRYLSNLLPKYKVPIAIAPLPKCENLKPNRAQLIHLANKNYHIINTTFS